MSGIKQLNPAHGETYLQGASQMAQVVLMPFVNVSVIVLPMNPAWS